MEPSVSGRRLRAVQSPRASQGGSVVGIFGLVVALATLAGCSLLGSAVAPGTGPLLTVELRGGLCPAGTCDQTYTLERDGRLHVSAKPPNDLGVVNADKLTALDAAIRATDFDALRSHAFTGQCPTAFDGQELVFEFGAPGGTQRVASCDTAIDWHSPLFVAVAAAVGQFVPIPTT